MKKTVLILIALLPFCVSADDCCNDECTCHWALTDIVGQDGQPSKQLTITGTGAIKDYTRTGETRAPWRDDTNGTINAAPGITKIVIEKGITSIGKSAFEDMWHVTSVSLPDGLKSVGEEACNGCFRLSEINLPSSLETLEPYAFYNTHISNIDLPANLKTIKWRVFGAASWLSDITIPEGVNISPLAFEGEDHNAYVQNVYCSAENASCQALKNRESMAGKVQFYQKDGDGYFYKNRWYASPNDIIGDKHIKKRIYTIEEANQVTGKANSVKIRYR